MQTKLIACACASLSLLLYTSCNHPKDSAAPVKNTERLEQLAAIPLTGGFSLIEKPVDAFIESAMQHFTVASQSGCTVIARGGLKIKVIPADLETEDGEPVKGSIRVNILELTSSLDLFRANAATNSNGRLLVSGGSYYVGMEAAGRRLRLRQGHTVQMEIPRIKEEGMELFYGNRDATGNLNWGNPVRTLQNSPFLIRTNADANTTADYALAYARAGFPQMPVYKPRCHLFTKPDAKVIFQNQPISLPEMVKLLQARGVNKVLDTVYGEMNIKTGKMYFQPDADSTGPVYEKAVYGYVRNFRFYRIIAADLAQQERDSLRCRMLGYRDSLATAQKRYSKLLEELRIDQAGLATQLASYYAPTAVGKLGWINCDHFYDRPCNADIPISMSEDFKGAPLQYFIIFRSFNGLMNGCIKTDQPVLTNMPEGEPVTMIGFTRKGNNVYQFKKDFTLERNKPVQVQFSAIPEADIRKMFGKNAVI